MKRSSFLKSLFTLAVAPKVIGEINFDKLVASNIATASSGVARSLISDLQLLTPQYYKHYVKKYGQEDYLFWMESLIKPKQNNE